MKDFITGIFAVGIIVVAVSFMAHLAQNAPAAKIGMEKHLQERMLGEY